MTSDAQFEEVVSSLPELAAIDDGTTVIVSRGSVEVLVTRVDYDAWVKHLTEYVLSRPPRWIVGVEPFVSQHLIVQHAVIREAYRGLAEVAFECENLLLVPELLQVMGMMVRHCRTLLP